MALAFIRNEQWGSSGNSNLQTHAWGPGILISRPQRIPTITATTTTTAAAAAAAATTTCSWSG